jgi:hypothetical protein
VWWAIHQAKLTGAVVEGRAAQVLVDAASGYRGLRPRRLIVDQ